MNIARRSFRLSANGAFAGLAISFYVPRPARGAPRVTSASPIPTPNAFLRVGSDESVTVLLAHAEMAQGIWTGLAMVIAEELECDWARVRSEHAPVEPIIAHTVNGIQMAGGASSTFSEFDRYRSVGAAARDMLMRAAATRLGIEPWRLRVDRGVIAHGTARVTFGEVAEIAMQLAPPTRVKLKEPNEWKLIGTRVRRLDSPEKLTGKATFGMDLQFPGLRTAVVARPPRLGIKLIRYDATRALAIPGVEAVVRTDTGVAVVASSFWAAQQGRDALKLEWSLPAGTGRDADSHLDELRALAKRPGAILAEVGLVDARLRSAKTRVEAEYTFPYLAHAPMEPLNCTAMITGDRCEIWTSTQYQSVDQQIAANIVGTTPDKIALHTTFLGGGFGRRATPTSDFVAEAVTVAKATGAAVKTVWTRDDDIRGEDGAPACVHRIRVGIDALGLPVAWDCVVAGGSVEGIADSPYLKVADARRISVHATRAPVTGHTAFAIESMVDELAYAARRDPLEYRLALLCDKPRHTAALRLAANKARWSSRPPQGRARGIAVHESFGTIVAQIAEVSVEDRKIRVHKVTCVVDCGIALNPLAIEAQIQGGIGFGLGAALHGELLRMDEMPRVAVHVIQSRAKMGGIGEPAVAPIAPAVANAVFALTHQRLRTLPLRLA
jgi:isoquinoline 1-oxidoreductase beta subunit